MSKTSVKTRRMVSIAFLAALSAVLMQISFPLPGLPPFLKIDISSVPIMIGSFMFGPIAGVTMAAIKALVDFIMGSSSGGVGQIADFVITSSFALTAGLIYRFNRTRKGALIASIASVFVIMVSGAISNWFILLPAYSLVMPMDKIIEICRAINPAIKDARSYIIFGVLPFNFIKGVAMAFITQILYKRISGMINRYTEKPAQKSDSKPD